MQSTLCHQRESGAFRNLRRAAGLKAGQHEGPVFIDSDVYLNSFVQVATGGTARFADLIERTLYNGLLPGISLDGTAYFYANALQGRSGAADDEPRNPASGRAGWFDVACCPPNIMRTVSSPGNRGPGPVRVGISQARSEHG